MASRVRYDQRGVAGPILALMLTSLLGMAALVIDVGNSWQERRHLVTATDAGALAAAQDYVDGVNGCSNSASAYVTTNNGDATNIGCTHVAPSNGNAGRVTVTADVDVNFNFGRAVGMNGTTVSSSTTANYDEASAITGGLRPFGLCDQILNDLNPTPGDGVTYRIYYGLAQHANTCAGTNAPGNWGVMDFDGGSNPDPEVQEWIRDGYDGTVAPPMWIDGQPGTVSNSLSSAMDQLLLVDHFTLPVFTTWNDSGGNNAGFYVTHLVEVKLIDYKLTGNPNNRYIDLQFVTGVVGGTGGGTGQSTGAYVLSICAVDATAVSACN